MSQMKKKFEELGKEIEAVEKQLIKDTEVLNIQHKNKEKASELESREKGLVQREVSCNNTLKEMAQLKVQLKAAQESEQAAIQKLEAEKKKLESANKVNAELAAKVKDLKAENDNLTKELEFYENEKDQPPKPLGTNKFEPNAVIDRTGEKVMIKK